MHIDIQIDIEIDIQMHIHVPIHIIRAMPIVGSPNPKPLLKPMPNIIMVLPIVLNPKP